MQVACVCGALNPGCSKCLGEGVVTMRSCRRCGGTGRTGGPCQDCRGLGWRELDQPEAY